MKLSIVAAVFILWGIPTVASAHAGNNDPNVVHACIGNVTLYVRIVGVLGSCISSPPSKAETPAHWDIQGPPGTNGTNGTNGIDGIDGTSVTVLGTFSGNQHGCPNGGTILGTANGNSYVCNGQDATHPDQPCFDNTNRYVDCGNGTVTDTVTGLIWLNQGDCLPSNSWAAANEAAAGLKDGDCGGNLTDKSSPGDWRLPTKEEWSATVARALFLGCLGQNAPPLTNDAGTACLKVGPTSFAGAGGVASVYWSSSSDEANPPYASAMFFSSGVVSSTYKAGAARVWPVRGGPR